MLRKCVENGKCIVTGDKAEDNQSVGKKKEDCLSEDGLALLEVW
jgi:hypothetical protein